MVALSQKVVGPLGRGTLLEDVGHWRKDLRVYSLAPLPVHSLLAATHPLPRWTVPSGILSEEEAQLIQQPPSAVNEEKNVLRLCPGVPRVLYSFILQPTNAGYADDGSF